MGRDVGVIRDDGVVVLLDTFHDHRNAYFFETNPNGSRTDALTRDRQLIVKLTYLLQL